MCKAMGATNGFSRHDNDGVWAPLVKEANEGKGIDVILDCVGARYQLLVHASRERRASGSSDGRAARERCTSGV